MEYTVSRMISDETMNKIIQIESAGNPNAGPSTSTARGLGQFIKLTWIDTVKKHRPDLMQGRSRVEVEAMRMGEATASLQVELLARFTEDNAKGLGPGWTEGDLYLAHFLGLSGAKKVFNSGHASSRAVCGEEAYKANKSIFDKNTTCSELRAWAQRSMDTRWDNAKRPNWVAKWYRGPAVPLPPTTQSTPKQTAPMPPSPPPLPPPPIVKTPILRRKKDVAAGTAGGTIVVGGGEALRRGAPWEYVVPIALVLLFVIGVVWWVKRKKKDG